MLGLSMENWPEGKLRFSHFWWSQITSWDSYSAEFFLRDPRKFGFCFSMGTNQSNLGCIKSLQTYGLYKGLFSKRELAPSRPQGVLSSPQLFSNWSPVGLQPHTSPRPWWSPDLLASYLPTLVLGDHSSNKMVQLLHWKGISQRINTT